MVGRRENFVEGVKKMRTLSKAGGKKTGRIIDFNWNL
jgi:hypothetical protein